MADSMSLVERAVTAYEDGKEADRRRAARKDQRRRRKAERRNRRALREQARERWAALNFVRKEFGAEAEFLEHRFFSNYHKGDGQARKDIFRIILEVDDLPFQVFYIPGARPGTSHLVPSCRDCDAIWRDERLYDLEDLGRFLKYEWPLHEGKHVPESEAKGY